MKFSKIDTKSLKIHGQDLSQFINFKQVQQYYIKNLVLGQGSFAKTFMATYIADQSQILACKMIEKKNIINKLKNTPNQEQKALQIID